MEGRPWEQILRFSAANRVDLIVMSRTGESQWFGHTIARTVERVAQASPCPVLILGQDEQHAPFAPRRVILTTDFSDGSLEAFPWADRIARRFGAQILLVNVQEPMALPGTVAYAYFHEEIDSERIQADTRLEAWRRKHLAADLHVNTRVIEGMVTPALCRLAKASQTDLIVMSTHGGKGWVRKLLGGTTEVVLRNATCSMLLAPPWKKVSGLDILSRT
jgi:nucleotide-binding universal stress UspA family protein